MEKVESGGIWTYARWIPRKPHYIMRNYAYIMYTKFGVATDKYRVTDTVKDLLNDTFTKVGDRVGFEPTLVG